MQYEGNDIYCDLIVPGKLDVEKIYEDEEVLAFYHSNPYWPVHIIVIPKPHIPSLTDSGDFDPELAVKVFKVVRDLAKKVEDEYGAASVMTNLGEYQHSKHLHFHIYHGEPLR